MKTRLAVSKDAHAIAAVMRRSIEELCHEDHKGQQEILNPWLENKTSESVEEWILSPYYFCVIGVTGQDQVIGFGMLKNIGEILLLYTSPDFAGRGIGRSILTDMENQARDLGLTELSLDSTLTAKSFYERHGYTGSGTCSPRPDCLSCQGMHKTL